MQSSLPLPPGCPLPDGPSVNLPRQEAKQLQPLISVPEMGYGSLPPSLASLKLLPSISQSSALCGMYRACHIHVYLINGTAGTSIRSPNVLCATASPQAAPKPRDAALQSSSSRAPLRCPISARSAGMKEAHGQACARSRGFRFWSAWSPPI